MTLRIRRLDIEWGRVFIYGGSQIHEPAGSTVAFLTLNDITESHSAAATLRASEKRHR